jgi:hypothetical protein
VANAGGDGVAEQDVARPQEDEVQRPEHRQREEAAQVGDHERAMGPLRAREHHGEPHAEQQREDGPEFSLDEIGNEPAREPVDTGQPGWHSLADSGESTIEELDVHQEDAEDGKASHHVELLDSLTRLHRAQRLAGG